MFQVGRYDPQAEERKSRKDKGSNKRRDGAGGKEKKKKKRKRKSSNNEEELDHGHDVKNHRHSEKKLSQNKSSNVVENSNIPEIQEKKKDKNIPNNEDDEISNVADNQKIPMKTKKAKVVNQNAISANKDDEGMESDSSSSVPSSSSDDDDSDDDDVGHSKKKSTEPAMHVIAPEQSPVTYLNRRNLGTRIDEEMDDFDDDDVLIEKFNKDGDNDETTAADASTTKVSEEISMALHMSSLPIKDAAATWGLASFLVDNLEKDGYDKFFPIQSLVIPDVIASERHAHIRARDVCVAAPTGSGKTLAFVLPVLNALAGRKVRRLRALVVLPSRDLAMQVYKVFDRYTEGSDLKVGLAIGQSDFKAEQEALTVDATHRGSLLSSRSRSMQTARQRYHFHRGNLQLALQAFPGVQNEEAPSNSNGDTTLRLPKGGKSAIDVLVATPGRLVDHLSKTPGFTLQHLRFLIIDEADRLVNQSYHNWIGRVVGAANEASVAAWNDLQRQQEEETSEGGAKRGVISPSVNLSSHGNSYDIDPITWRRGGAGGDDSEFNTNNAFSSVVATVCRPVQLRKLLYSATLTRDPQKLASLGLINAKHFDAHQLNSATHANEQGRQQRYSMPPGLSEYTVECTAEQKPLVLLALLLDQISKQTSSEEEEEEEEGKGIIVVFTSSLDSTHRLARLLQLLWGALGHGPTEAVAEFSSALNQKQRSSLMKQCNSPDSCVSVIVCSDGMSRGMDIPSVSAVINYDVPSFAKTYVHRCGRTARAGRKGSAISVLKGGQVTQFNRMRRLIEHPDRVVAGMGIRKDLVRHAVPAYRASVKALGKVIQAEADNDLHTVEQIPATWIPRP